MTHQLTITAPARVRGEVVVPGDKSISHRALILAALAGGSSRITHRAPGDDQEAMIRCLRALGVGLDVTGDAAIVTGVGLRGLHSPREDLDCGNSGSTMRFLAGALAATPSVHARLVGDASLSRRPMARVAAPLALLGGKVHTAPGGIPPLDVAGEWLHGASVRIEVPSAQVKTAVLLAALQAYGITAVTESVPTRDHTERLLRRLGVDLRQGQAITLQPPRSIQAFELDVPGDPSSAAFWAVLAACHPDAELAVRGVCLNGTRTGWLDVLRRMGADIRVENTHQEGGEEVGDLVVRSSELTGTTIESSEIPSLVDEVPVLAVAATCARGDTVIRGAGELRLKEVDRLATTADQLGRMGAAVAVDDDDLVVGGPTDLRGTAVSSLGDHRMAMSLAVAACLADGETAILDPGAAAVSYPRFYEELDRLGRPG